MNVLEEELTTTLDTEDDVHLSIYISGVVAMLADDQVSRGAVERLIALCQNAKQWPSVISLAEALIAGDPDVSAETQRRYAQALIELGALTAADLVLDSILESQDEQIDEALGLKGRVAKQRYIEFHNSEQLRIAVASYADAYRRPDPDVVWAGGNLLALLSRAERDGVCLPAGLPNLRKIETELRAAINSTRPFERNIWQRSVELELAVYRKDFDLAADLASAVAGASHVSPFELGSLQRQLTQVWELESDHKVVRTLTNAALELGIDAETIVPDADHLDKILNSERPVDYDTYLLGLTAARSVCKITDQYGLAVGTGFVLPGRSLSPRLGNGLVLLTNAHVVSPAGYPNALRPTRALARFTTLEDSSGTPAVVGDMTSLWSSPPEQLDATVLRLRAPEQLAEQPISIAATTPDADDPDAYVYVIGHPQGHPLSLSIRGNKLLDSTDEKLHYLAPTEAGSSGSPVFDKRWDLVGLHHAGSSTMARLDNPDEHYPANEAININAIRAAINAEF